MNSNVAIQNEGVIAWDGVTAFGRDITRHARFAFSIEVVGAIAVNAVFNIQAAPPSADDPCVAGVYVPVPEISICDRPAIPAAQATIIIPAGTPIGTVCSGTIPCRPNKFVRINPVSGTTANVRIVMIRNGPMQ